MELPVVAELSLILLNEVLPTGMVDLIDSPPPVEEVLNCGIDRDGMPTDPLVPKVLVLVILGVLPIGIVDLKDSPPLVEGVVNCGIDTDGMPTDVLVPIVPKVLELVMLGVTLKIGAVTVVNDLDWPEAKLNWVNPVPDPKFICGILDMESAVEATVTIGNLGIF